MDITNYFQIRRCRLLCAWLVFCLLAGCCFPVFAAPQGYSLSGETETDYGQDFVFTLTSPTPIPSIAAFINGQRYPFVMLDEDKQSGKYQYKIKLSIEEPGEYRFGLAETDATGQTKAWFTEGESSLLVRPWMPLTRQPYIQDCDMAAFCGIVSSAMGSFTVQETGFYYGDSPDKLSKRIRSNPLQGAHHNKFTKLVTGLIPGHTYYCQAFVRTSLGESLGTVQSFTMPAQTDWDADAPMEGVEDTPDRFRYIFDSNEMYYSKDNPPPGYYGTGELMEHLTVITVPIWRSGGGNKRIPSTKQFMINKKLSKSAQAIFQDLYDSNTVFCINKIYTTQYRTLNGSSSFNGSPYLSHHSFGTAIDLNHDQNLFYPVGHDGRDKNSPFYISPEVIDVFEKHGWVWGGDFAEGIDSMHFQYTGLELLPPET